MDTKLQLQDEFIGRDDDFWGIEYDPVQERSRFQEVPELSGSQCSGFATMIRVKLGHKRVTIHGFFSGDNPNAGVNELSGGHDFAVVDNRYIVDPWIVDVETGQITTATGKHIDLDGQGVFDIEEDVRLVKDIYGDASKWSRVGQAEERGRWPTLAVR